MAGFAQQLDIKLTYRPLGAVDRKFVYRELGGGGKVRGIWYDVL